MKTDWSTWYTFILVMLYCYILLLFFSRGDFLWLSQSNSWLLTPANQLGAQAQGCVMSVFFYWCWQHMSRLPVCILLTRLEAGEGAGLCVFLHHSLSYTIVMTLVNLRLFKSSTPNSRLFLSFFPPETMRQLISLNISGALVVMELLILLKINYFWLSWDFTALWAFL